MEEKRLLLIVNPCAGQRRANRFLPEILRIFWDHGYCCVAYVTSGQGDATRYAAEHAGQYDLVVCIGGDGTLNETIAGVLAAKAECPIGYIPAGTTNDYANSLGLSTDVLRAAKDAVEGTAHALDMGCFNGRYFTYTASCGIFTRVSYSTSQQMKNVLGHAAYILEGIKDLTQIRPLHMRVEYSDEVIEDDFIFCAITNSTSVGGILKLNSRLVALDDGKFEVMLIRNPVDALQLSRILHGLTTQELPNEMVYFFTTDRLSIHVEEPNEWTLDGERADGAQDVELQNLHGAVQLILPEPMELNVVDEEEVGE